MKITECGGVRSGGRMVRVDEVRVGEMARDGGRLVRVDEGRETCAWGGNAGEK